MVDEPQGRKVGNEAIDAGLRQAFQKGETGRSVLARLESKGGPVPRVVLTTADVDVEPIVRPGARGEGTGGGRYEVAGEIARGGVGVVLKGRDVDLGREVAVKVLLERHESNAEIVQRFVEEAMIGGQLQHPGVVPVHELGITADGRPFIAMKLVKGRTLAEILTEPAEMPADLTDLLGVFERVCQTLAYAHSRKVVHRDLKPSNVMVGSFGEVQVLDWGLAKVLRRGGVEDERRATRSRSGVSVVETVRSGRSGSDSVTGSVMGTPEYMAPEQAEGRVEDIDERTDVFALGAVLCEILTGQPPYCGKDRPAILDARECRQADAHARLDACGADSELVALAKHCLREERDVRPRSALAVSREVAAHLAGIRQRVRDAELAAAEAGVRIQEERKARRVTLALSAAVIFVILLGSGGWIWQEGDRHRRVEEAAETVNAALVEAARLRGEAKRAPVDDPSEWGDVRAEAERILSLVQASSAPPEVRARAEAFLAAVRGEADLAQVAAVSARRDREVVARLLTLSLLRGDDFDPLSVDLAFGEAFSSHELDVGRLPATVVAEKIKGSGIAAELVVALDDWIAARREIRDGSGACRLLAILRLVDPMAARDRIRTLAASADAAALAECAKETDDLSVETLLLLGDALGRVGDVTTAKAVLAQARLRSPADFRTAFLAGFWRSRADPPDHARAVPAFSLMVALRPGEAGALYHYGQALHEVGDIPGALGRWIDALAEDPELYGFLRNRIADAAVSAAGKLRHASVGGVLLEELSRVAELFPQRVDVQRELGVSLARAGSWEAARIALARALWSGGDRDSGIPLVYSVALCRTGDEAGAIRVLSECARQNPEGWSRLVRLPDAGRIVHRPPSLGASAAAANQGNQGNRGLLGIGRGLLMMGAPDAALVVYEEICRAAPQSSPAELGRGVALHYLNQPEKAARAFQRASDLDPADAAPLYWLGSLRAAAGESEEAYRIWDRAFELDPGHLRLRAALTDGAIRGDTGAKAADVQFLVRFLAMHEAGPSAKAGAYEEAARRAPENLSLARGLARYLRLCGRDRKAVRAYVRALENAKLLGKQQGLIVANHATLLAESDDPEVRDLEAALRLAREGLQLEDTSYGHVAEGIALYRLGRCDEAVAALTGAQSVKIDRTLYLSMARMQAGDKGGAEKELDAALKTIRDYWAGRSLDGRTAALLAEACGLLGRPLPSQE